VTELGFETHSFHPFSNIHSSATVLMSPEERKRKDKTLAKKEVRHFSIRNVNRETKFI
jgi:hypothetical protein